MPAPKNAMEIFQVLDKSNCRECGEKTCLAFAGAVFRGQRRLEECPKLDAETMKRFSGGGEKLSTIEENRDDFLAELKDLVIAADLAQAARRVGARYSDGKLTLKVMGKNFSVDDSGKLYADIHVNPWIAIPFLNYILHGEGREPTGEWVSFRELAEGKERYPLFQKRCEAAMKRVADVYTDLFDDMIHLFDGRQVAKQFESDISVVLHPLPRVPIMICYWRPDDGLASDLNIFFDRTADKNLDNGAIFSLGAGLATMFEKLAIRHGVIEAGAR
jgi:hypothetical protein